MTRTPPKACAPRILVPCSPGDLILNHMQIREARLVRLNPNVTFKTRGNAAIALDVEGDPERAFSFACDIVEELADFSCENTNPGVVVAETHLDPAFYRQAVTDFCEIDDAVNLLERAGVRYQGWKNRRGLIGATAAVASACSPISRMRSSRTASLPGGAQSAK
jgi:tRNA(Ile2)-agmatinylcytidine synthase